MIRFYSLLEAISYRQLCPLCGKTLQINDRDLAADRHDENNYVLSFYVNQREDDILVIDMRTEVIELEVRERMPQAIYTGQSPLPRGNYNLYHGDFNHALHVDCKHCCQYAFTLQLHMNLDDKRLIGIFLNSESVSIEDGSMVHEIKNVYATNVTEYACFPKDGSSRRSSLPLIPLDLENPKETVSRIRKLLIFS